MPVAQHVDSFDGRALGDRPPRANVPRGTIAAPSLPSAVGRPALAQTADGTENIRANYATHEAGSTRPAASSGRGPSAPQHFTDASV